MYPAWEIDARSGYLVITPMVGGETKSKNKGPKEWASEKMARAVYGGRDPKEAKSAEAVYSRLNALIGKFAPGYDYKLFGNCHMGNDLLARHGRNVDLCVITAMRRYCLLAPETHYPCVIRSWPWDDGQIDQWVTMHKARALSKKGSVLDAGAESAVPRGSTKTKASCDAAPILISCPAVSKKSDCMAAAPPLKKAKTMATPESGSTLMPEKAGAILPKPEKAGAILPKPKAAASSSASTGSSTKPKVVERSASASPGSSSEMPSGSESKGSLFDKWGVAP